MKIKINENETYEIRLNEEISFHELKELVRKIEFLSEGSESSEGFTRIPIKKERKKYTIVDDKKLLKNVVCVSCGSQRLYKKGFTKNNERRLICKNCHVSFTISKDNGAALQVRKKPTTRWKDRNEVLNAVKIHYFGTDEEKNQFAEMKNTTWMNVMKAINNLRRRFNVKPQEVGLEEFPNKRGKKSIKSIPNLEPFKIPTPQPPLEIKKEEKEEEEEVMEKEEEEERVIEVNEEEKPKWWNRK